MRKILAKWCVALALVCMGTAVPAADPPAAAPAKDATASPPGTPATTANAGTPTAAPSAGAAPAVAAATAAPADPRTLGRATVREPEVLARFTAGLLPADFIKLGDESAPFLARYAKAGKPPVTVGLLYLPAAADFVGADAIAAAALRQAGDGSQSVLAVQMPLATALGPGAEPAAIHDQSLARAKAGLEQLTKDGAKTLVVVGRAEQGALTRELAADSASGVRGVVIIGPWIDKPEKSDKSDNPDNPDKQGERATPLLEFVPGDDASAAASAEARRSKARAAQQSGYRQHVIEGADRYFVGNEEDIARRIAGWAAHLPAPKKPSGAPADKAP